MKPLYKEEIIFNFAYKLKKRLPLNNLFFFIFFFLKYLGTVLLSHRIIGESNLLSFSDSFLSYFTYFGEMNANFGIIDYNLLCLVIYLTCILVTFLLFFSFTLYKKTRSENSSDIKIKKSRNFLNFILTISYCLLTAISLLSQHLIEILSFSYLNLYVTSSPTNLDPDGANQIIKEAYISKFSEMNSSFFLNKTLVVILNTFAIIFVNICVFYFIKLSNGPFMMNKSYNKFLNSKRFIISLVIIGNLQGLHYYSLIFSDTNFRNKLNLINTCICLFFSIAHLLSYRSFIFVNYLTFIKIFLTIFAIISSGFEIIFYLSYSNSTNEHLTRLKNHIPVLKILLEIILAIFFTCLIILHKRRRVYKNISGIIFSKLSKMNEDSMFLLVQLLKDCEKNLDNFKIIFRIINDHTETCEEADCTCTSYEPENFFHAIRRQQSSNYLQESIRFLKFKQNFLKLIIFVENEILNSISEIHKNNTFESNFHIFLLHIDFTFVFKRNPEHSIYLVNIYRKIKNMPIIFRYHLLNLEKEILKRTKMLKKESEDKEWLRYEEFYKYNKTLERIKEILLANSDNFEVLIKMKNTYNKSGKGVLSSSNSTDEKSRDVEILLKTCIKLHNDYKTLTDYLDEEFSENCLKNAELCFLISNFFSLIDKRVPLELENSFIQIDDFYTLSSLETSFEEVDMRHPVIAKLSQDSLTIEYLSQKLCDYLGYHKYELLGKDFHHLIPAQFSKQHLIMMKKFILVDNKHYLKKDTFILTKEQYYFPVGVSLVVLPKLKNNVIIMDICPKYNQPDANCINYFFVLDRTFNVITFNKEFEDNFMLTYEMFEKLKISLLSMFHISDEYIMRELREEFERINRIDVNSYSKLTEPFRHISLKKMLNCYEKKSQRGSSGGSSKNKTKHMVKKKHSIIPYLVKLETTILEYDTESDWLKRVHQLEKNLYKYTSQNKLVDFKNKAKKFIQGNSTGSDVFRISIGLRNVACEPYYFVRLTDPVEMDQANVVYAPYDNNSKIKSSLFRGNLMIDKKALEENTKNNVKDDNNTNIINNSIIDIKILDSAKEKVNSRDTNIQLLAANYVNLNQSANMSVSVSGLPVQAASFFQNESSINQLIMKSQKVHQMNENNVFDHFEDSASIFNYQEKRHNQNRRYRNNFLRNMKIDSRRKKERLILVFLFACLVILISLSVYNIFFTSRILDKSLTVFQINFNSIVLRSSILYTATAVLSACFKVAGVDPDLVDTFASNLSSYTGRLSFRSGELYTFVYKLKHFLTDTYTVEGIEKIFEILHREEKYTLLDSDWKISERNSTFIDELDYYHYYTAYTGTATMWKECKYENFKISKMSRNFELSENLQATYSESVVYYMIYNVMSKFKKNIGEITILSRNIFKDFHSQSQYNLILFNMSLIIVTILLTIAIVLSVMSYKHKITSNLETFYTPQEQDELFEQNLANYRRILRDLDRDFGLKYEQRKEEMVAEFRQMRACASIGTDIQSKDVKKFHKNKNDLALISSFPGMNVESITGADRMNRTNTKNSNDNLNVNEGWGGITIRWIRFAVIVVVVAFSFYIVLISINISINVTEFNGLILSNQIALNFLGRVPKIVELLLFYRISIMIDDPYFISKKQEEYDEDLNNYFEAFVDIKNNSMFEILGDSAFAYIYYVYQIDRKNVKLFLDGPYEKYLPNLRNLENNLNSKEACVTVAEASFTYLQLTSLRVNTHLASHASISSQATECRRVGRGINMNGFDTAMENQSASVVSLYLDYFKSEVKDKISALKNVELYRATHNVEFSLKRLINGYLYYIEKDMEEYYQRLKNIEFILSVLKVLIAFVLIFYVVFFVILKLQYHCFFLNVAVKKFQIAIRVVKTKKEKEKQINS